MSIKINGELLSNIIKPDQMLVCDIPTDILRLSMDGENVEILPLRDLDAKEIESFNSDRELLERKGLTDLAEKRHSDKVVKIEFVTEDDINYKEYFAEATEEIILSSDNELNLLKTIFKAKEIFFGCTKMDLYCYLQADMLEIRSNYNKSLCKIIRMKFKKEIQYPIHIFGKADFEKDQINIGLFGLYELGIVFSTEAFE